MATRAAAHSSSADASAMASAVMASMQADRGSVDISTSVGAVSQSLPHAVLDHTVYQPSTVSAFANAAPVAAATADATLQASPVSSVRRVALPVAPSSAMSRSKLGRPSSKFGTVNYSIDEMRRLNEKVRTVMPIASEDWLHVAYQFNYMRPESIPYREVESLKRKFKKMYCSRSTVGGKLPEYVQEAKELRKQINQRSERAQIQLEQTNSDSQSEADPQDAGQEEPAKGDEAAESGDHGEPITEAVAEDRSVAMDGSAEATNDEASEETRVVAARLRAMEEEYHRSIASKRGSATSIASQAEGGPGASGVAGVSVAYQAEAAFASSMAAAPLSSASVYTGGVMSGESTAGIINLLKHSIERKRRTIEEQMLSESERVRKERKKRKMEQVLYNIHREHESATSGGASDALSSEGVAFPPNHPLLQAASAAQVEVAVSSSSLGVMEIVLSYMVTQQQETTRRAQLEGEQRRVELAQREQRRQAKELQRRKDKHEMMLVMAALLQDGFPEELRHYLDPASVNADVDDDEENQHVDGNTRRVSAQPASQSKPVTSSSNAEAAAAAAAIASSLAPVAETLL